MTISLRTNENEARYSAYRKQAGDYVNFTFDLTKEKLIWDFKHWGVIDNLFPYDKVAETHHLLVPKRIFADLEDAEDDELKEYFHIKKQLTGEYDLIMESLSGQRSIAKHFHFHLIKLKASS